MLLEDQMNQGLSSELVKAVNYQVYGIDRLVRDDEVIAYTIPFKKVEVSESGELVPTSFTTLSTIEVSPDALESLKNRNTFRLGSVVTVTITPSEELDELFSDKLVIIDGVEYSFAKLDSSLTFVMDDNHKIQIIWMDPTNPDTKNACMGDPSPEAMPNRVIESFRLMTDLI